MAKRVLPLLDRVLIEKIVAPSKSIGGVLLPESAAPKVGLAACGHAAVRLGPCNRPRPPASPLPRVPRPVMLLLQVNQGTVLAVGPGRRSNTGDVIPVAVKQGDNVLLPEYGGTPIKLDDKE